MGQEEQTSKISERGAANGTQRKRLLARCDSRYDPFRINLTYSNPLLFPGGARNFQPLQWNYSCYNNDAFNEGTKGLYIVAFATTADRDRDGKIIRTRESELF